MRCLATKGIPVPARLVFALLIVSLLAGCSMKKFAINKLGDSLANSGTTFASDDDPELVGGALPFSLKLIESLLAESPRHKGLLFAASSGFTQYTYVYLQQSADQLENVNLEQSQQLRHRARRLFLRARDYGLRGLEVSHPNFRQALALNPQDTLRTTTARDVPLLYWTAASWGAAISNSKDDPDLIADQRMVEVLIDRAYALNPNFESGAIESFLLTYESARQGATGDFADRSRQHFDRAVKLTDGKMAGPFVAMAETVSVAKQDRSQFETLLKQALAIDPDTKPEWRLSNIIMQRRARWLLQRTDELFLSSETTAQNHRESYALFLANGQ